MDTADLDTTLTDTNQQPGAALAPGTMETDQLISSLPELTEPLSEDIMQTILSTKEQQQQQQQDPLWLWAPGHVTSKGPLRVRTPWPGERTWPAPVLSLHLTIISTSNTIKSWAGGAAAMLWLVTSNSELLDLEYWTAECGAPPRPALLLQLDTTYSVQRTNYTGPSFNYFVLDNQNY